MKSKMVLIYQCLIFSFTFFFLNVNAQNTEFTKANFSDRKTELKEVMKWIKQGDVYYKAGEGMYRKALELYLKANNFNPNNAELNYKIGKCYLNSNQKTESVQYLEKAIELDPKVSPDVNYLLAQGYHLQSEFTKAIDKFKEYKKSLSPVNLGKEGKEIDKKIQECELGKELTNKPSRVFIDNIGDVINSSNPDYNPIVNADESVMMFISRRDNTTGGGTDPLDFVYYEDIYISNNDNGTWGTPENPGKPLNSDFNDAVVGISPDGQTLLIFKGTNGGDIYECKLKGDKWSNPKSLNNNINTSYHESSASFSYDGRTIYFVSDRPGGFGGRDIYVSKINAAGEWDVAKNLGATINTPYDEEGVFMHPDGKTLYFSSKGQKTMGGYDIFKTVNINGQWSTPENLGYPINTPDDDVFFSISANGIHGYYSSAKTGGLGGFDIYTITFLGAEKPLICSTEDNLLVCLSKAVREPIFEKKVEIQTNFVTLLKGRILDEKTNEPLGAVIEITDNAKNEIVSSFESNSVTGKYLVSLPSGFNYGIAVKSDGYLFYSENLDIPAASEYKEIEKDIKMKKIEVGNKVVLKNIFFDFGKATLRSESIGELNRLAKLMKDMPTLKIEVSGHTDNIGTHDANQTLSEKRALAVYDYLVQQSGIERDRMTYVGYAYDQPIATNATEEGRQLNRRTEFKVTGK